MKTSIFILFGAMIYFRSNCQLVKPTNLISLQILDDSLKFNAENWRKNIVFKAHNESYGNLLVYGINTGGFRCIPFEVSNLCELESVGMGLGVILYDSIGRQLFPSVTITHRNRDKPMTRLRLDSTLQVYRNKVTRDTVVFRKDAERVFTKAVDITHYKLEKGTYFLQIAIYCGREITFSVSMKEIALDCKRLNAVLYQGCSFSNKIKVVVD